MRDVVDVLVSKARWRKKRRAKIRPSTSAERIRQPKRATEQVRPDRQISRRRNASPRSGPDGRDRGSGGGGGGETHGHTWTEPAHAVVVVDALLGDMPRNDHLSGEAETGVYHRLSRLPRASRATYLVLIPSCSPQVKDGAGVVLP
jgi:hypothetical protein